MDLLTKSPSQADRVHVEADRAVVLGLVVLPLRRVPATCPADRGLGRLVVPPRAVRVAPVGGDEPINEALDVGPEGLSDVLGCSRAHFVPLAPACGACKLGKRLTV